MDAIARRIKYVGIDKETCKNEDERGQKDQAPQFVEYLTARGQNMGEEYPHNVGSCTG